jgi:hypothetical protein
VEEADIDIGQLRAMIEVYESIRSILVNHQERIADYVEAGKD